MSIRRNATAVFAFALILSMRSVEGGAISYTEMAVGSGSLGGMAFTNELITLTVTADTTGVMNPSPGFFTVLSSLATVSVASVGSGTLAVGSFIFDRQSVQTAGLELGVPDILDITNAAFATYDLTTSIGPVTGSTTINAGSVFATSAGDFIINTIAATGTFQAMVGGSAVPEPSSILMAGLAALVGLGLWSRRREC